MRKHRNITFIRGKVKKVPGLTLYFNHYGTNFDENIHRKNIKFYSFK